MDESESRTESLPVGTRNFVAQLEMHNPEIDTWVKHTVEGSPYEIEVELITTGSQRSIRIEVAIEITFDEEGNAISEDSSLVIVADENLAKSIAHSFGVTTPMVKEPYEGWGAFRIDRNEFSHSAGGDSYTLDIRKDYAGSSLYFHFANSNLYPPYNPTVEGLPKDSYVRLTMDHDLGACLGHLIAAAFTMPSIERGYAGEMGEKKGTREFTFSTKLTHHFKYDEPQE